jgi:hypothetical protein
MSSKLTGSPQITGAPGTSATRTTTAAAPVGQVIRDADGRELKYVKTGASISAGVPVCASLGLSAVAGSTDVKGFIGVAEDLFASGDYGWVVTNGVVLALVPSGTSVGDPLSAGNAALSATLTNAVKHAFALEAAPTLSGTTQLKSVYLV